MAARPNVVFFFADDQRFDTIHALGNDAIRTPNLDRLVGEGFTFRRAHIPGGSCGAVCMPSRAMLHTGRTLFHIDDMGQEIPDDQTLLGETFQRAGYRTFGTGKWHNGRKAYARSFTDGDEIMFGGMGDHWNVLAYHFDPSGKYDAQQPVIDEPMKSREVRYRACDHVTAGKHSSELFCDAAIGFLEERAGDDKPFFMYVSFMAPHDPRSMPEEFRTMYDPNEIELPPNFCGGHVIDTGALRIRDENLAGFPRDPEETKVHIAEYYAMITHLDHEMGRVMAALEEKDEYENTIFVFAGDNGLSVGQHGLMGKQSLYEHSVRVPLIFAGPGIPQAASDSYAYLLDIYPTLCSRLGLDIPESVEGADLSPIFSDPEASVRDELYLAYADTIRACRQGPYKYIEYATDKAKNQQLFDVDADPWELHDLTDERPETVEALKTRLREMAEEFDDPRHPIGMQYWDRFTANP